MKELAVLLLGGLYYNELGHLTLLEYLHRNLAATQENIIAKLQPLNSGSVYQKFGYGD